METLPHDLLFDLLLHLKDVDLLNLCFSNKRLAQICDENNDYFWQQKTLLDYFDIPPKSNNISWKRYYVQLGTNHLKRIPIYYEDELLGYIWISRDDTPQKILQTSNELFKSLYPNERPMSLRNQAEPGSPEELYWNVPLFEYDEPDQPQRKHMHSKPLLTREMYNGTSKLTYMQIALNRPTFSRSANIFRGAQLMVGTTPINQVSSRIYR